MMKYVAGLSLVVLLSACGVESPRRSSPQPIQPEAPQAGHAESAAPLGEIVGAPKLDILFVVDNSMSMERHQENLARNIDQFVQKFTAKGSLDFHIGVITIWDAEHAEIIKKTHPLGQLLPLQDPNGTRGTPLLVNGQTPPRYVTRDTPNLARVLAKTIVIGDDPGPVHEEMFRPVEEFIKPENLASSNQAGFYRPDAHFLLVFITDANDSTVEIDPSTMYRELVDMKGGKSELLHTYAILSPTKDLSCHKDQAGPPYKFDLFLTISGGTELNLCAPDFGQKLSSFGSNLSLQVSRQVIPLAYHRDVSRPFNVCFSRPGEKCDPKNPNVQMIYPVDIKHAEKGYMYNRDSHTVMIGGDLGLKPIPGGIIQVQYTPLDLGGLTTGDATKATGVTPSVQQSTP